MHTATLIKNVTSKENSFFSKSAYDGFRNDDDRTRHACSHVRADQRRHISKRSGRVARRTTWFRGLAVNGVLTAGPAGNERRRATRRERRIPLPSQERHVRERGILIPSRGHPLVIPAKDTTRHFGCATWPDHTLLKNVQILIGPPSSPPTTRRRRISPTFLPDRAHIYYFPAYFPFFFPVTKLFQ